MGRKAVAPVTFVSLGALSGERFGVLCTALAVTVAPTAAQEANNSHVSDWKRGAVCYEIFVRSFYDSDGAGVGDR